MDRKQIIKKTEQFVKSRLKGDTGHDWAHIDRVRNTALYIGKLEKADLYIVELAALLHDIADWKFHKDEFAGGKIARKWLAQNNLPREAIDEICFIVDYISWKGGKKRIGMRTIEGAVVQDADRLDALGAIGIARAFNYGGFRNRPMHAPEDNSEATIAHFYEKILHLKDRMNTKTGRKLAQNKDKFVRAFLKQFLKEWAGQA
jgi:uncharacterized protein